MKESFNKKTDSHIKEKIKKVHCNISRIWPISFRSYKYYLLVTNDITRYSWVRFLKTKAIDEVFSTLIKVIYMIERETADKVVIVRADNDKGEFGLEFIRRCNKDGIVFEPCLTYCSGAVSGASTFFEGSSGREVSIRGIDEGQQLRDLSYKIRFIIILLAMRYVSFNWQYILHAFDSVSCQCSSVTRQPGSPPL